MPFSSPPIDLSNLAQEWNAAGTTFTAIKMNVTDTASAAGSLLMDLQVNGVSKTQISKTGGIFSASGLRLGAIALASATVDVDTSTSGGILFGSGLSIGWSAGSTLSTGGDLFLRRDAANTLAQRNGANGQSFRVYDTYTDASNYRRIVVAHGGGGGGGIILEGAGTGNNGDLFLRSGAGGSGNLLFQTGGTTTRWKIDGSGHFLAGTDNTYDIGASGANRPRSIYAASSFGLAGDSAIVRQNSQWEFNSNVPIMLGSSIVRFSGATASFPALKRSAAVLQSRLADDSDFAPLQGKLRTQANAVAETPTATHTMIITDAGGTAYRVLCAA